MGDYVKKIFIIGFLVFAVDFFIKLLVSNFIGDSSLIIIKNIFQLTYVRNLGAAFNIFNGNRVFLILATIFCLFIIYHYFIKNENMNKYNVLVYGLLFGGILGNFFDRIVYGYVIDYIDLVFINFPIFNFADMCIVTSMGLIIFGLFRKDIG